MHDPTVPLARLGHGRVVTRRQALNAAKLFLAGAVGYSLLPSSAPALAQKRASVKVSNNSDWEIHHFFLSLSEQDEWGPDQLGEEVIGTGEAFTLKEIPCDTYDVRLVDEDGDECVVEAVDICGADEGWVITNKILLGCKEESQKRLASQTHCPRA
jgi:hypothetical protein